MESYNQEKTTAADVSADAMTSGDNHNCSCHPEIVTDGSGQLDRYLKALDPSYAPIDGRSTEDLLVFAKRYADQIRFHDLPTSKIEDGIPPNKVSWKEFFKRDMAVIAASIAVIDTDEIKKSYEELRARAEQQPESATFGNLFDPILGMAARIDEWHGLAIPDNPLRKDLELGISSNLKGEMKKITDNEEGFRLYVDNKRPLKLDYKAIDNLELWGLGAPATPDSSVYDGVNPEDRIQHAILSVDDIFNQFYGFIMQIVGKSDGYLQYALEQYPAHQPHMALYISFIKLFRLAQDQMNGITGRMLDFYYREVLQLTAKPSIPDKAHIVFELAKKVTEYDLAAGTALTAGKDASGKDQVYRTVSDIVVNIANIKELKTIFIEKVPQNTTEENKTIDAIYARPVANSQDGFGAKFTDPAPKWPTFGVGNPSKTGLRNICDRLNDSSAADHTDQAEIGFAIASPQLLLQSGKRLVTIQDSSFADFFTKLDAAQSTNNTNYLEFWLTGEKGWLKVDQAMTADDKTAFTQFLSLGLFNPATNNLGSSYYIDKDEGSLALYLPIAEKQIIPYDPKIHTGYNFDTTFPVLRVMINPEFGINAVDYNDFSFNNISLAVKVGSMNPTSYDRGVWEEANPTLHAPNESQYFDGLTQVILQNENGTIQPGKPFDPFTAFPQAGKAFYIGSHEVFNKPLGKLAVDIDFTLSRLFTVKEENFGINQGAAAAPQDYTVSVLHRRRFEDLATENGDNEFYDYDLASNILNTTDYRKPNTDDVTEPVILERTPLSNAATWTPVTEKGFLRLENIVGVTGNESYSNAQLSQNLTPKLQIKNVSLSYESTLDQLEEGIDQFFHVYPFGAIETKTSPYSAAPGDAAAKMRVDAGRLLFPQFTYASPYDEKQIAGDKEPDVVGLMRRVGSIYSSGGGNNQYSGLYQEEGMLFIGLENLKPLQSVSMLFQFAEGSAVNEDDDAPPINWSYLSNNQWKPLRDDYLMSDDTYGFQTTGIVNISVPEDATTNNTIITQGLIWLCASVTEYSDRIPQLINIVANAVIAQFDDQNNDQSHFDKVLAAGSISKLSVAAAEINKVQQPFASFDGKHKEVGKEFYTRVSERLRHKGRAITAWDYEHLVLDRFPSIYKVKAITHTDPNCICRQPDATLVTDGTTCCGPQIAPGHVLVVPISDLKNRNGVNPLQPKTSRRTLIEIEGYLAQLTSPFVHVHAKNPVYEQIIVAFRIQFYSGTDKGYYLKKLNSEIVQFLTPWAFDDTADVKFGQKVYASSIINFIEKRPYVDFITDFVMGVCRNECCPDTSSTDDSTDSQDPLSMIQNCNDIEHLLEDVSDFPGDIIARPSTPRSILVSVPQHIIVPYVAPIKKSPCEMKTIPVMDFPQRPVVVVEQPIAKPVIIDQPVAKPVVINPPVAKEVVVDKPIVLQNRTEKAAAAPAVKKVAAPTKKAAATATAKVVKPVSKAVPQKVVKPAPKAAPKKAASTKAVASKTVKKGKK